MAWWAVALWGLAAVVAVAVGVWVVATARRDVSLIDRWWGPLFVVQVWVYAALGDGAVARELLLGALVTVWGLRLAAYVSWRNWGSEEDARYGAMRDRHGDAWPLRSLVTVFLLQGLLAWVVGLPLLAVAIDATPSGLTLVDALGVAVWGVGLFFEAVGDWQLARFLADPANRGTVMDRGLWRYTRHPNYFGDTAVWWGHGIVALATGAWWALVGPLVMTLTIVRVSGVALTEKRMSAGGGSSRKGYDDYVRRTNAFIPGPRKSS